MPEILANVKTDVNYELTAELMADISSKEDTSELLAIYSRKYAYTFAN